MKCTHVTLFFDDPDLGIKAEIQKGPFGLEASELHFHPELELIYVLQGIAIQQINERSFALSQGQMAVIGSNQRHALCAGKPEILPEVLVIQVRLDSLPDFKWGKSDFVRTWCGGNLLFPIALETDNFIHQDLLSIYEEYINKNCGYREAITAHLLRLLVHLYRNGKSIPFSPNNTQQERNLDLLADTFRLISEHYSDETLTLAQAAQVSHLSVSHFCRLFRSATDMSYHEYLNRYRLLHADSFLQAGHTLLETALECGFGSVSSFIRNYKRYYGISPRKARKGR